MSSVAKVGKCCQLPAAKIGNVTSSQNWRCHQQPKLANVIGCQSWQMLSVAKIGNVTSCHNWQISPAAKTGECHQLPKLGSVVSCQIWQILSTTCQNWSLNTPAYIWLDFLYRAKVHSNDYPPWCELANEVYLWS